MNAPCRLLPHALLPFALLLALTAMPLASQPLTAQPLSAPPVIERMSPIPAPNTNIATESQIQSAAAVGHITLAAWGTSVTGVFSQEYFRPELWAVLYRDSTPIAPPVRLHDDSARPHDVVAVLNLRDRFLVLWNDRRAGPGTPLIVGRLVDTTGAFIGTEQQIAQGSLLRADSVWLSQDGAGYHLSWKERTDSTDHYRQVPLNPMGETNGPAADLAGSNFDDDLTYGMLPGAHILRDTTRGSSFVHADGHTDPRPVVTAHLIAPHYLNPDTSILVAESDPGGAMTLATYPDIFTATPSHTVPFTIPGLRPFQPGDSEHVALAAIARDASGHVIALVNHEKVDPSDGHQGTYGGRIDRWTIHDDGSVGDSALLIATYSWTDRYYYGQGNDSYEYGRDLAHGFIYGDDNATHLRYDWTQYVSYLNGGSSSHQIHIHVFIDAFGNPYRIDPRIASAIGKDTRQPVEVRRSPRASDSSCMDVHIAGTTWRTIAIPLMPRVMNSDYHTPAFMRLGDTLLVAWSNQRVQALLMVHTWSQSTLPHVLQVQPFASNVMFATDQSKGESYLESATLAPLPDRFVAQLRYRLMRRHNNNLETSSEFTLLNRATPTRWDSLLHWAYPASDLIVRDLPCTLEPDSNTVHAAFIGQGNRLYLAALGGGTPRVDTLPIADPVAVLPLADGRRVVIRNGWGLHCRGGAVLDSFRLPGNTGNIHVRYQRLRGNRILCWYPLNPVDTAGTMRDSLVRFELLDADGASLASASVHAPGSRFDAFIWERGGDRAIFVAWGGAHGIAVTMLAPNLSIHMDDTLLAATDSVIASPVVSLRGDTLWSAWEEQLDGFSMIRGTFLTLPERMRVGTLPLVGGAVTMRNLHPNPANDHATIQVEVAAEDILRVEVFDALGRRVAMADGLPAEAGFWQYDIETAGLHPGAYGIVVSGISGSRSTARMVVVH
ncbi:MAG TPA: hypothetical protein VHI13_01955 [Candidatus Kapabacteria bacterium]|nr:hypothetical protein [Candidatus Kapabacteria bacterium]